MVLDILTDVGITLPKMFRFVMLSAAAVRPIGMRGILEYGMQWKQMLWCLDGLCLICNPSTP